MSAAFEFAKDEYVRITDEELKAFESQDGRVIDVQEFLPIDTVDPVYFDRTYYLGPGKGGEGGTSSSDTRWPRPAE